MTTPRFLLLLIAMGSGCFQANLPEVEITQRGLVFAGVPGAAQAGDLTATTSFTYSKTNAEWAKWVNLDVHIHQMTIAASGGVPNLCFIEHATATVAAPSVSTDKIQLLDYDRSQSDSSGWDIEIIRFDPVDITSFWTADRTILELRMTGQLPEQDWTVDVTMTLSGKIAYQL